MAEEDPRSHRHVTRIGWRVAPQLELALIGQNLHEPHHLEWPSGSSPTEVERTVHLRMTWRR